MEKGKKIYHFGGSVMSDEQDLYQYISRGEERVVCRFASSAKKLKKEALSSYLVPATGGGVFLCLVALVSYGIFSMGRVACGVLCFFGMMLVATGVLFYAIFLRRARAADGAELILTTEGIVYIARGVRIRVEYADIDRVSLRAPARLSRLPFDLSSLEGEVIELSGVGEVTELYFIEDAAGAVERISRMLP